MGNCIEQIVEPIRQHHVLIFLNKIILSKHFFSSFEISLYDCLSLLPPLDLHIVEHLKVVLNITQIKDSLSADCFLKDWFYPWQQFFQKWFQKIQ